MLTEYEMHMRLRGKPDVCQLYASFEDEANVYFVMELCTAGDAYNLVYNYGGPVPERVVVQQVLCPLLRALQQTHAAGVIHRDVKPENVFMAPSRDGSGGLTAKLGDFGLACPSLACDLRPLESLGTLDYMSPEVLRLSPWLSLARRMGAATRSLGSAEWELGDGDLASETHAVTAPTELMVTGVPRCGGAINSANGGNGAGGQHGSGHATGVGVHRRNNGCVAMSIDDDDDDEVNSPGSNGGSLTACLLVPPHSPLSMGASPLSLPQGHRATSHEVVASLERAAAPLLPVHGRPGGGRDGRFPGEDVASLECPLAWSGEASMGGPAATAVSRGVKGGIRRVSGSGLRCKSSNKPFTEAVDVWGVGVLAYELLCGELPFGESSARETCHHILCDDPPISGAWPRCLSMQAIHFIHSALQKVPSERQTVEGLLNSPLIRKHCPQVDRGATPPPSGGATPTCIRVDA